MMPALLRRKGGRRGWSNTVAATGWGESTYAELEERANKLAHYLLLHSVAPTTVNLLKSKPPEISPRKWAVGRVECTAWFSFH